MADRPRDPRDPAEPWDDDRLDAAFRALVKRDTPAGLVTRITGAVDAGGPRPLPRWRLALSTGRVAGAAAVVAILVLGVGVASWSRDTRHDAGTGYSISRNPDGTSTFATGEFRFAYPSAWSVASPGGGPTVGAGSTLAVLGTSPSEPECASVAPDAGCPLPDLHAADIRVIVGTSSVPAGRILGPWPGQGVRTGLTVAGMPAVLYDQGVIGSEPSADLDVVWLIARPASLTSVVTIVVLAREPAVADARMIADALIASFAFTPAPATLPPDRANGRVAAQRAIDRADADFRQMAGQSTGENLYGCQPDEPGTVAETSIRYGTDGDLGGDVPVRCSWSLGTLGNTLWRVELYAAWADGGRSGDLAATLVLDAAGDVVFERTGGDDPPKLPSPPSSPVPADEVFTLPVISVEAAIARRDAGPTPEEIAVRGWLAEPAVRHACVPQEPSVFDLGPRCNEELVHLSREPTELVDGLMGPVGPSLNPIIREASNEVGAPGPIPVDVIVVGHFDDPRSSHCPGGTMEACRRQFIADRIVPATGDAAQDPPAWAIGVDPPTSAGSVIRYLGSSSPMIPLSAGLINLSRWPEVEPAALPMHAELGDVDVWVVRFIPALEGGLQTEPPRITTYLVPVPWIAAGMHDAYEVADGKLQRVTWIIN